MTTTLVLPNLVIAGVGRSGTTSIFQYLIDHPNVCGSTKKETRFFEHVLYGRPSVPVENYSAYFSHRREEAIIAEASPGYFAGGRALAEELNRTLTSKSRVIVSFREPVSRLVSFYNFSIARMQLDAGTSLEDYVDLCQRSRSVRESKDERSQVYQGYYGSFYGDLLPEWFDVFGSRLRIVFFEDLQADPGQFMVNLSRWIGIDPGVYERRAFDVQNPGHGFRQAWMHRIATSVNDRAERSLRRRPTLKNRLRHLYMRLNSAPLETAKASPELRRRLEQVFADSNRRARAELLRQGYVNLPDWLASSHIQD